MNRDKAILELRKRRGYRVRKAVRGTADRPRLSVFRSNKHVYCQLIDDQAGKTLVSASTRDVNLRSAQSNGGNKDAAAALGRVVAEKSLEAGCKQVCFDRGPSRYHGRVAALADAAREAGLTF